MTKQAKFFWWARCSTCRDARRLLEQKRIDYSERDFFSDRLTEKELRELARVVPIADLFSWASPSARPYKERRTEMSEKELIRLMLEEPRLLRRPILITEDRVLIGFKRAEWEGVEARG